MTKLELDDYFGKMSHMYGAEPDDKTKHNAEQLLAAVNMLLWELQVLGIATAFNPEVNSGWRTPMHNMGIPNAAAKSKHMTGDAIDLADPEGELDEFLMSEEGRALLVKFGLYLEHPAATKGWCHLQRIPPRSGNRVFFP